MSEIQLQDGDDLTAAEVTGPRRPPFMFAKRHGVLVAGEEDGRAVVLHTAEIDPVAIVELRRLMGKPLKLQLVDNDTFDSQLSMAYEQDSNEAMLMMGDLGEGMDLMHVAEHLPEPEDLHGSDACRRAPAGTGRPAGE